MDDESDEEVQLDERWLLSYSDLMTLLFGFFVILYAMSLENPKQFDSMVKSLAIGEEQEMAGNADEKDIKEEKSTGEELTKEKFEELSSEILNLKEKNSELEEKNAFSEKTQTEQQEVIEKLEQQKALAEQNQSEQKEKIETLKKEIAQIVKKDSTAIKVPDLQKEIAKKEAKNSELTKQNKTLKTQLEQAKASSGQATDLQKELSKEQAQNNELSKQNENLKSQLAQSQAENQQLKKDQSESSQKNDSPNTSFVSVMIYWTTKDHDIDLSIKSPDGLKYNFKKREFKGKKGKFILDTRRGPGAEIWRQEEMKPGIYTVTISLYSQYSNPKPAIVNGNISTSEGLFDLKKLSLTKKNRKAVIRFRLKQDAQLEILP